MKRNPDIDRALNASVKFLAGHGLSAKAISKSTGLSISQVYYRTGAFDLHIGDFRRGENDQAKRLMAQTQCAKHNIKAVHGETYRVAGLT